MKTYTFFFAMFCSAVLLPGHASAKNNFTTSSQNITHPWIRHFASGLAAGSDEVSAMAIDDSGNVYVTGTSTNLPFGMDFCTIKYNSSGVRIWSARYDGGQCDNGAFAVSVDASGNVYVTGTSRGTGTDYDYATIKYNASGEEQWAARYNGTGDGVDCAIAIAVDGAGNVYVTGFSFSPGTSNDYATIKYNASGEEQWVARYNGPGDDVDVASDIVVDGAGNVYVTGFSCSPGSSDDYATIKYNASGEEQWVARHAGLSFFDELAPALAVDGSGNVYVKGSTESHDTSYDYAVIKYNAAGEELWVAQYNGPTNGYDVATALAIDGTGNVYVTGESSGLSTFADYTTIKYNSSGEEQWVARYNLPEGRIDRATAIAVDNSGNVYVTGESESAEGDEDYATIKYNAAGEEQWAARYNGTGNGDDRAIAIAVDGAGDVYVTGNSEGFGIDYSTIKYSASGQGLWIERYNGPGNSIDEATDLAVDGSGNVYVTGKSRGSRTEYDYDYATVKYNSAGEEQWAAHYNGPANDLDEATALAVDAAGNVYVTGLSCSFRMYYSYDYDYLTIKYNSSGQQQWVARYKRSANSIEYASDITVDAAGNVYVTGTSDGGSTGYYDYTTIRYNSSGGQQWVVHYNGAGNGNDEASALGVDAAGNVYVTGSSSAAGSFRDADYATIKYNSTGRELWVARYNGPANGNDEASALAIDNAGNVYVTGSSSAAGSFRDADYATIKYNSAGREQWAARYDGPGNGNDEASALGVDGSGNVYVTGSCMVSDIYYSEDYDYATIKYDSSGQEQWAAPYNGPGNGWDKASALAVDNAGNVYVTGTSEGSGTEFDFATINYNSAGREQWVARNNGPGNSTDRASAIAVDGSGNVYVTGYSMGIGWSVYTTIKYTEDVMTDVFRQPEILPDDFILEKNFPNPFNSATSISVSVPYGSEVKLTVYNVWGKAVKTVFKGRLAAGHYRYRWDGTDNSGKAVASGHYFYHLSTDNGTRLTGKMTCIK